MKKLIYFGAVALTVSILIFSCGKEVINESKSSTMTIDNGSDENSNNDMDNFEDKAGPGAGIKIEFVNGRRFGTLKNTTEACECPSQCFGICQIKAITIGVFLGNNPGGNGNGNGNGNSGSTGLNVASSKLENLSVNASPNGLKNGILRKVSQNSSGSNKYLFYVPKSIENIMEDKLYFDEDIIVQMPGKKSLKFHKGEYPVENDSGVLTVGETQIYEYVGITEIDVEEI